MEYETYTLMFTLGFIGGGLSGLLGIGGGIIMVPLLLYVPPVIGLVELPMRVVAGMTTVQSFIGAISGASKHNKFKRIHIPLACYLGIPMAIGSFSGSFISKQVSNELMLQAFGVMAVCAAILMFLPKRDEHDDPDLNDVSFSKPLAIFTGATIGIFAGIIGQGGAFLFIPAMIYLLSIPTRIVIGTALLIGIMSSAAVFIGRLGSGQIPWGWSAFMVAGVLIGAQVGAAFSQKTPVHILRHILAVIITGTAIKIWFEVL